MKRSFFLASSISCLSFLMMSASAFVFDIVGFGSVDDANPNGLITVNVSQNDAGCDALDATYTITVAPVPSSQSCIGCMFPSFSTPQNTTPTEYTGMPSGMGADSYLDGFMHAARGVYTVTVTQTNPVCRQFSGSGTITITDALTTTNQVTAVFTPVVIGPALVPGGGSASSLSVSRSIPQVTTSVSDVEGSEENDTDNVSQDSDQEEQMVEERDEEVEEDSAMIAMTTSLYELTSDTCGDLDLLRSYEAPKTMGLPAQVRLLLIRYLETADGVTAYEQRISSLVCKITEIRKTRDLSVSADWILYNIIAELLGRLR